MKESRLDYTSRSTYYLTLIVLLIPNILLCFTEHYGVSASLANILLPGGIYMLIMLISGKLGRNILCLLPVFVFAAFQLVLLYLYGRSIIAVDMFLNLVTTNSSEAGELLGNLLPILSVVFVIYVPILAMAIFLCVKNYRTAAQFNRRNRRIGITATIIGLSCMGVSFFSRAYSPLRDLYPLNVCYNIYLAVDRTIRTAHYDETSAAYRYDAKSTHPKNARELYILIVGETSRAADWQLLGYQRETTPLLSARNDLFFSDKVLSESNTTHKSVPLLLSPLTAKEFDKDIYHVKGILTAFKEAGFSTAFLSNQRPNHSFIDKFAFEADTTVFIRETRGDNGTDLELLPALREVLKKDADKMVVILHTYGSHFNYRDRYTDAERHFLPDTYSKASPENRQILVNAYDNSLRVTDKLINSCIDIVASADSAAAAHGGVLGGVLFTSDHGEDIYDNGSDNFLHASPLPSRNQVHVPFVAWLSPTYRTLYPKCVSTLSANMDKTISSSRSFTPTALQIAGMKTPRVDPRASLLSSRYTPKRPIYLDDHNRAVPLDEILRKAEQ